MTTYVDLRIKRAIEEGDTDVRLAPIDFIMAVLEEYDVSEVVDWTFKDGLQSLYESSIIVQLPKPEEAEENEI